jgi:flavin reductase (DIM6/NTAB) family NADH-FMN oxidoreductase RutF
VSTPISTFVPNGPEAMAFRHALRHFPTGVSVITISDGEDDTVHGMTASSFSPVSLDPRLCAVSVNKPGRMHQLLQSTDGYFGLSILRNTQGDIADFYARQPWAVSAAVRTELHAGCPVISDSLAWFVCRKWGTYDGGDHSIFVGQVLDHGSEEGGDVAPLIFHHSQYWDLGAKLPRSGDSTRTQRTSGAPPKVLQQASRTSRCERAGDAQRGGVDRRPDAPDVNLADPA